MIGFVLAPILPALAVVTLRSSRAIPDPGRRDHREGVLP